MYDESTMRGLAVQVDVDKLTGNADALVARLRAAAESAGFEFINEVRGNDNGPYVNMNFAAVDYIAGWSQLRRLFDDPDVGRQLAAATIIVCEGRESWNDYLLLHHFDPGEKVDDVHLR